MSAQVLSHLLDTQFQVANSLIDHSIRAVDEDHRNLSALLRDEVGQRVYDGLGSGIVIVPGYVWVFDNSILSEYGRGYTDKTAERVAVGLANLWHDTILHIQKQVPMYSSHPGNMPTAKVLDAISYRSAAEITGSWGANAQVLNEHTVSDDLVAHNIPVWVYNPFEKDAPRTIISAKGSNEQGVQFVDKKENISTVTISSYSMSKPGILELITNCFKELWIPIGIPSGSETAVSLTTYRALDDAEKNTLSANIKRALWGVGEVNITDTFWLIYCIGDHLEWHPGILAKITKIIAEANIDIKYASQPVWQWAVVIGVNSEDLERWTNLLHAALITQKN
jgi:aspartate kinase